MQRLLVLVFGCFAAFSVSTANAQARLQFTGSGDYQISGSTVTITYDGLKNIGTTSTSPIYLKLMAMTTDSPYGTGYKLAEFDLSRTTGPNNNGTGVLTAGQTMYGIVYSTTYTPPPSGTYYVYLQAFEYPYLNTVLTASRALTNPKTFTSTSGGGSGNTSSVNELDLVCPCSYQVSGDNVTLNAAKVANNRSGGYSGTLRLKLWATTSPYPGSGAISGYTMTEYSFSSQLAGGFSFSNISASSGYTEPPAGTYYLTMTLTEFSGGQDFIRDHINFDGRITIGGSSSTGTGTSGNTGGGVNGGSPTDLDLSCDCSYDITGSSAILAAAKVANNRSGGNTGTLQLTLMATSAPYSGGYLNGYTMATYTMGQLNGGSYFSNVRGTAAYTQPPAGTYYVTMALTEYQNGQFYVMDHISFDRTVTIGSPSTTPTDGSARNNTTSVDLICQCSYEISGSNAILKASRVVNNRTSGSSGSLKLSLFATTSKYSGTGTLSGYEMGNYQFSSVLNAQTYFSNINRTVSFVKPPNGTYYVVLVLSEYSGGQWTLRDFISFDNTVTFSPSSSGSTITTAYFSGNQLILPSVAVQTTGGYDYYRVVLTMTNSNPVEFRLQEATYLPPPNAVSQYTYSSGVLYAPEVWVNNARYWLSFNLLGGANPTFRLGTYWAL